MSCEQCQGFCHRERIRDGRRYRDLVRQLIELKKENIFEITKETCSLEKVLERSEPWDDLIEHFFRCTKCGQEFRMGIETYHGSGGSWEVIEEEVSKPAGIWLWIDWFRKSV